MADTDTPAEEVYRAAILAEVPRVIGLMDREPFSPTLGCCDRVYWAWKFTDFPGARFQEALCVLGFVYATEFSGNIYHRNPRLLEWLCSGLRYWSSIQYPDGSFDEAYPYERSLAATAFTTFYVGEALNFLGNALPADVREQTRATMGKAGAWLCRNDETHGFLSNHLAAAAAALHHVYRETEDSLFAERSRYFIDLILSHQSGEGWYDEYGSADPGYQTHGSFYLARYWQQTQDQTLLDSLDRATDFLARFVHPDGSIGGEYASRNTQTYYPAAFEMLATRSSPATWVAEYMRPTVFSGSAADLRGVDAYNYFPFLNNIVFAYISSKANAGQPSTGVEEPGGSESLSWYPEAGIARIRRNRYDAYVGTAKAGVIKIFDRRTRQLVYSDCGYIGKLDNGRVVSSQYFDNERKASVIDGQIEISGNFSETSRLTMKPLRFIGFRLFMLSAGRFPSLARWLKGYLVKVLIYRKHRLAIDFHRSIKFNDDKIIIKDRIAGPDGKRVSKLERSALFTTIHMGSSRYFINNELTMQQSHTDDTFTGQQLAKGVESERVVILNAVDR